MDDIVIRLREASSNPRVDHGEHWNLHDEAADEIERLRGIFTEIQDEVGHNLWLPDGS